MSEPKYMPAKEPETEAEALIDSLDDAAKNPETEAETLVELIKMLSSMDDVEIVGTSADRLGVSPQEIVERLEAKEAKHVE